jgi:hypothetical protein
MDVDSGVLVWNGSDDSADEKDWDIVGDGGSDCAEKGGDKRRL